MKSLRSIALCLRILWLFGICVTANSLRAEETNSAAIKSVGAFQLKDQYDQPHSLTFPKTNLTVLTVADRKGSEQIDGWIQPLKERYGKRIDIAGVADVSKVPFGLHGFVQSKFKKRVTYPVMLDWDGRVAGTFHYASGQASVLVLDREGTVLMQYSGVAQEKKLKQLFEIIDRSLGTISREQTAMDHAAGKVK